MPPLKPNQQPDDQWQRIVNRLAAQTTANLDQGLCDPDGTDDVINSFKKHMIRNDVAKTVRELAGIALACKAVGLPKPEQLILRAAHALLQNKPENPHTKT